MAALTTLECFKLLLLMAFPMIAALTVWGIQEKLGDMYRKRKKQRTSREQILKAKNGKCI